jgi:membrane protein implicated in regulation of membrane protease activity
MEMRLAKAAKDHPKTEERQMAEVMLGSATEANAVRLASARVRIQGTSWKNRSRATVPRCETAV